MIFSLDKYSKRRLRALWPCQKSIDLRAPRDTPQERSIDHIKKEIFSFSSIILQSLHHFAARTFAHSEIEGP